MTTFGSVINAIPNWKPEYSTGMPPKTYAILKAEADDMARC